MTPITGPNGAVVLLPDDVAQSLVGNGTRGYAVVSETQAPTPAKRVTRKTTTK